MDPATFFKHLLNLHCPDLGIGLFQGAEWTQALGESFFLATKAALTSTHGWCY